MMENQNSAPKHTDNLAGQERNLITTIQGFLKHWKWYLASIALCLLAAWVYSASSLQHYVVQTSVLFVSDKAKAGSLGTGQDALSSLLIGGEKVDINNEIQILTSRRILQMAIEESGMYATVKGRQGIRPKVFYSELPFRVVMDKTALDKLPETLELTLEANNSGAYTVRGKGKKCGSFKAETGVPGTFQTPYGIVSLLKRDSITSQDPKLSKYTVTIVSPERLAVRYVQTQHIRISHDSKGGSVATMMTDDPTPQRGEAFLWKIIEVYNRQRLLDKNKQSNNTYNFITDRIAKIASELEDTEKQLERAKQGEGIVAIEDLGSVFKNRIELEQTKAQAQTQLKLMDQLNDFLNKDNDYELIPNTVSMGGIQDATLSAAIELYNQLLFRRNTLLGSSGEQHPTILALNKEIATARNRIREAAAVARQSVNITLQAAKAQENLYAGKIASAPAFERITGDIMRQREIRSSIYLMLLKKREETSIEMAANAETALVIDHPLASATPSVPKVPLILLMGLVIGCLLPTGIILLRNVTRTRVYEPKDIREVTGLTLLGTVPATNLNNHSIVVDTGANDVQTEIFRTIRTNLTFVTKNASPIVVFVTSTTPSEGKTFIATNLASSFAALGKSTLVVGLDIRKPKLAEALGQKSSQTKGVTDLINDPSVKLADVLETANNVANLHFINAGTIPPNPAELLADERLDTLFAELKQQYDYIIVDTAPVGPVVDTLVASRVADVTVYVTRAGKTERSDFEYIHYLVRQNKLPNVNILLNGVSPKNVTDTKQYGYGYGYGYGKSQKEKKGTQA